MNITSITEVKEPTTVTEASVLCKKCNLPNGMHATSAVCSHCRISDRRQRVKGLWETLAAFLKGLVVKDREAVKCDALPPSVVSD